jgi:exodeoxyribonuclease V alpha subunit
MFYIDPSPLPVYPELSTLDLHFARFICSLSHNDAHPLFLAAALASNAVYNGHVCCDLATVAYRMPELYKTAPNNAVIDDLEKWLEFLKNIPEIGNAGDNKPLILCGTRLYLQRYFAYERSLADELIRSSKRITQPVDAYVLSESLALLFPDTDDSDMQKLAALTACVKNTIVITGGPGTGKTTVVAKILALQLLLAQGSSVRIALAAPTGKAAARMKQSVAASLDALNLPEHVRTAFPQDALTIHRLLGVVPHSPHFYHNANNLLPYDIVVIDEGSMIDLALMTKLLAALPSDTKLILLGDRNQLASVEAGAVMGDVCDIGRDHAKTAEFCTLVAPYITLAPATIPEPPLADCIVELTKNYRFSEQSGINALAQYVKQGNGQEAWQSLIQHRFADCTLHELPLPAAMHKSIGAVAEHLYKQYLLETNPIAALTAFDSARILCAVRKGPCGVETINTVIEQKLAHSGYISPSPASEWYCGRPIMITANDYELNLFNGDIGLIMNDPDSPGECKAYFRDETEIGYKAVLPQRLPPHETVYAMTVHKAQGSEFNNVLLLLPAHHVPVLSRELMYTAVTRARMQFDLWSTKEVFLQAAATHTIRMSGLRDALWKL